MPASTVQSVNTDELFVQPITADALFVHATGVVVINSLLALKNPCHSSICEPLIFSASTIASIEVSIPTRVTVVSLAVLLMSRCAALTFINCPRAENGEAEIEGTTIA